MRDKSSSSSGDRPSIPKVPKVPNVPEIVAVLVSALGNLKSSPIFEPLRLNQVQVPCLPPMGLQRGQQSSARVLRIVVFAKYLMVPLASGKVAMRPQAYRTEVPTPNATAPPFETRSAVRCVHSRAGKTSPAVACPSPQVALPPSGCTCADGGRGADALEEAEGQGPDFF